MTDIMKEQTLPKLAILQDGTEIRLVPLNLTGGKPLYVSKDGQGYTYVRERFKAIKDRKKVAPTRKNPNPYNLFRNFKSIYVHRAVKEAWDGPCPPGYEIDHVNGNTYDNRLENLEYVTHTENCRRRWVFNARHGKSFNGKRLTELGRQALWKRRKYAREHGISLVQMVIEFDGEPINNN